MNCSALSPKLSLQRVAGQVASIWWYSVSGVGKDEDINRRTQMEMIKSFFFSSI